MTPNCASCNDPTTDFYPAILPDEVICKDCHENGIRRSTIERVYFAEELERINQPRGIRITRKERDEY